MKLRKNMGKQDRLYRLATATILLLLAAWLKSWILLAASLFVFAEALFSWCIVYQFLGKSTCPVQKKK
jgi:hypothetical protein